MRDRAARLLWRVQGDPLSVTTGSSLAPTLPDRHTRWRQVFVGRAGNEVRNRLPHIVIADSDLTWMPDEIGPGLQEEFAEGVEEREPGVRLDEKELPHLVHFQEEGLTLRCHDEIATTEDDTQPLKEAETGGSELLGDHERFHFELRIGFSPVELSALGLLGEYFGPECPPSHH